MAGDDNPLANEGAAQRSDLAAGAMLAAAREAAGHSIDAVAAQLKLAPRQVRALESGDFAALPGRTFVRGFIRNYARFLGIDADRVLAALPDADADPGLSHPHLANTQRAMGEIPAEHVARRPFAGWAIAIVLAAIVAAAVLYEKFQSQGWPISGARPPATAAPKGDTPPPLPPPLPAPKPEASPAGNGVAAPDGKPLPNPVAPSSGDAAPSMTAPLASDPAAAPGAPPAPTAVATPPLASDAVHTSTLEIVFRGESWVDIKDARGASLLTLTGSAGMTRTLDAPPPVEVVVGNAGEVELRYRGAHVDLAPHARQNVARLTLR